MGGGGIGGGGMGGGGIGGGGMGNLLLVLDSLLFSLYKDVIINMDWNINIMCIVVVIGLLILVVGSNSLVLNYVFNFGVIILVFVLGECGSESWGGILGVNFVSVNV